MLKVKQFVFNMFGVNTFVVSDPDTREAAVIDPGMFASDEQKEFDEYIESNSLKIVQLINTHMHLDHCFGDNYVRDKYGVKVSANVGDASLGADIGKQIRRFGGRGDMSGVTIDVKLREGDTIKIGSGELQVIETPGHSKGGICLYCPQGKFLISGDTLFRGGIGRTDLEGGDQRELTESIRKKLFTLPDDTTVLPGHDRFTTIGDEKRSNPYV